MTVYQRNEKLKKIVVVLVTGLTAAIALNYFLIPANVFSAGMNGIAQIIASLLSEWFHIQVDTGAFIFILNIPVFILGFLKVGETGNDPEFCQCRSSLGNDYTITYRTSYG